jgi:hypothetical protein
MKKFLRYQLELEGTNDNDLNEKLRNVLDNQYDNKIGIFNSIFGEPCEVNVHIDNDTIVLCGCIIANTKKECDKLYDVLKIEAKKIFKNCEKTLDLLIATGDKLY